MDASLIHQAATAAGAGADSGARVQDLAWAVLFFPLAAAIGTAIFARKDRLLSAGLNISAVVLSFILSFTLFCTFAGKSIACTPFHWLPLGDLDISMGLQLDRLSTLMLLIVTGVASLVMIFSTGYMKEDPDYCRFFQTLSLFVFSMLGIVLADNFVMMFVFWELVGVSSYLLIGFWHQKAAAGDAAKKAFLTNRLGDFGFLLGIILIWAATGSVKFSEISDVLARNPAALGSMAGIAGLLVFLGAMGKSAQFPLHVWLPDAMEGPTPVSALIHAATMVAAGVYMLCRVFFLYQLPAAWPGSFSLLNHISAADIIAWIGGFTALLAALIAVQQNDIKRILAYSTLSQLGYMVMAVGAAAHTGNPSAAMYHLTTHAFFKALLFLGAGSVIHACHHEQDIWKMGGLKSKLPWTFWTFLIGTAALAGLPPFSGFYSKDEILSTAMAGQPVLFVLAVLVAVLTTFYMSRLVIVAFLGQPRSESASHAHESPRSMTGVLATLAIPSIMIAWLPIGGFLARHFDPKHTDHSGDILFGPFNHSPLAASLGLFAVLLGISVSWAVYAGAAKDPVPGVLGAFARAIRKRFYFDEIYEAVFVALHDFVASIADWLDRWLVGGLLVRGLTGGVDLVGRTLRLFQTGNLQTYALFFVAGLAALIIAALR